MHGGHSFCSLRHKTKTRAEFFLLHNFTDWRLVLILHLSNLSIWLFFLSLLSRELLPFHLKEALESFFLAYPSCQLQHVWAASFTSLALGDRYYIKQGWPDPKHSWSDNQGRYWLRNEWDYFWHPGWDGAGCCKISSCCLEWPTILNL